MDSESAVGHGGDGRLRVVLHAVRNHAAVISGFIQILVDELDALDQVGVRDHLDVVARNSAQLCAVLDAQNALPTSAAPAAAWPGGPDPATRVSEAGRSGQRLLVVEDDDDHFALLEAWLARPGTDDSVVRASCLAEARKLLVESPPDCTLVDLSLPDASGLDALDALRALAPSQPIVVVTGSDDALGVEAVRRGAQDYLLKGQLNSEILRRSVLYAIERIHAEAEFIHQALHDPLTGLPNRTLFLDRVERAVARLDRHSGSLAVLFLDLDHFKVVNDTLGHEAGDQILQTAAERLALAVRRSDTLARLGGDEFAVLCEDVGDEADAAKLAEHLMEALAVPVTLGPGYQPIRLGASIGAVVTAISSVDPATLLRDADTAMYQAKENGRGRLEFFDAALRARVVARYETEAGLRLALDRHELRLHYQPEVALSGGQVVAVEALLRWQHPERGLLAPQEFLALAEDCGLILPIGAWVLQTACAQLQHWQTMTRPNPGLTVWVNVSPRQLDSGTLLTTVTDALAASGAPASALGLEITEGAVMGDIAAAIVTLDALRALGVKVAIDDFGVGYASLNWLRRLPLDIVKLDKSFIDDIVSDADDRAIVASVTALAHSLDLTVVAEGVETQDQLTALHALGCDMAQGYFLGRPAPPEALSLTRQARRVPGRLVASAQLEHELGEPLTLDLGPATDRHGDERSARLPRPQWNGQITVVIADDDPHDRRLLRMTLELDGRFAVVGEATNGQEALKMVSREHPDAVVIDIGMPVMDGYQAISAISAIAERSPPPRIVAVSARDDVADRAKSCGATACLLKTDIANALVGSVCPGR